MYHSNDTTLPHCALVDPRTGVLLSKWNEIDVLDKLEHSLGGALNTTNRKRQLLIDQVRSFSIANLITPSIDFDYLKIKDKFVVIRTRSDVTLRFP